MAVALDIRITPELKEEGQVREVIRQIQAMRKSAGLKAKDKISIQYSGTKEINKILDKNKNFILKETRAEDFMAGERPKHVFDVERDIKIGDQNLWLGIKKL